MKNTNKLETLNPSQRLDVMGKSKAYHIENVYYDILKDKVNNYDGGYFEMVATPNCNPLLFIDSDEVVSAETAFQEVDVTLKEATIAFWLLNVNWASWAMHEQGHMELSKTYSNMYYDLLSFVMDDDNPLQVNQGLIYKIID